jgi:hypothetical protein
MLKIWPVLNTFTSNLFIQIMKCTKICQITLSLYVIFLDGYLIMLSVFSLCSYHDRMIMNVAQFVKYELAREKALPVPHCLP